jgi:phage repressor protein C with HTH and peptisase S24 domain
MLTPGGITKRKYDPQSAFVSSEPLDISVVIDSSEQRKFTLMTEQMLKERLQQAIDKSGVNATKLALQIERDRNYFRDFLNGKKRSVDASSLSRASEILGVSVDWLTGGTKRPPVPMAAMASPAAGRLLPLYGQAVAGDDGRFPFNGEVLSELPCPPQLERTPHAYAVNVLGDSMEPRYRSGSIAYVNPSRAPRRGDDVVVQVEEDGELWGYLKEFVGVAHDKLTLLQLNPSKKLVFPTERVRSVHVVHLIER